VTDQERREQYELARARGELVRLCKVPRGRSYVNERGKLLHRVFNVSGDLAESLVLPATPCPAHPSSVGFPWEACAVCENSS
jgi:hypothetical protein